MEKTPEQYINKLIEVFKEIKRILHPSGICWINIGDTYYNYRGNTDYQTKQTISNSEACVMNSPSGKRNYKSNNLKSKDLIGIPWMLAFALRDDGWYLRQDIIWSKGNPMPESVKDRCTKSHEYVFLLTKSQHYFYDADAIQEKATGYDRKNDDTSYGDNGVDFQEHSGYNKLNNSFVRNKRSVWNINTKPFKDAHFAVFPEELSKTCIKASVSKKGNCSICGEPYVRDFEYGEIGNKDTRDYMRGIYPNRPTSTQSVKMEFKPKKFIGWKQSCNCKNNQIIKPIIIDPFFGSGTTGVVAKKLMCNYIGIELNPNYVKIAKDRLMYITKRWW